jgi:F-type H+-transporting ATPase subunit delta
MAGAVAFRYARALADLASKPEAAADPQGVIADLEKFERALAASQDLRNAMQSPAVPPARKRAVMSRLANQLSLSDLVRRFLMVLIDHRRAPLLGEIREAFETVMDERLGVVRVDVLSARDLTATQRDELLKEFSRATGKKARARFEVDASLIGGVIAKVGSTVFDGSLRGQLQALKARMAGAGG